MEGELGGDAGVQGGGGRALVGLGAAVAVVNDASTTSAGLSNNVIVTKAGAIDIDAVSRQTFSVLTPTVTAGAAAVGAAIAKLSVNNPSGSVDETRAYIGTGAQIGQGAGLVGSV